MSLITDLTDDDIRTVWPSRAEVTMAGDDDATDADGTDGDSTDDTDGDGDSDGTDADGTDGDSDGTDA